MKLALALIFAIVTSNSFAVLTKTKIIHLSVNVGKSYGEMFMLNNEQGDIDHFEWRLVHPDRAGTTGTFTVEELRKGTVFKKGMLKKFLKLIAPNFSAIYGGEIKMRYPKNIITRRYRSEVFEVTRNQGAEEGEVRWPLNHRTKMNFKYVEVIVNKFLGAPIGADKILFR